MTAVALAIETAFPEVSVALQDSRGIWQPRTDLSGRRAASLHAATQDLFEQTGCSAADVGEILIDVGPGSYTGLRVGVALVRTFTELVAAEVRTVRSTDQLAWHGRRGLAAGDELVVLLDARRDQWFVARYQIGRDHSLELIVAPHCIARDALRQATSGAARIVTATDTPPLDEPVFQLGSPAATQLFALRALAEATREPVPMYLMPPV